MIYPPILASTQPAFEPTGDYAIEYSIPEYMALGDYSHLELRLVYQNSNQNALSTSKYPDGVIYRNAPEHKTSTDKFIISTSDLAAGTWLIGRLYKVQMRVGINPYDASMPLATWKRQQIETPNALSEWSNVMIIKPIEFTGNGISICNADSDGGLNTETTKSELTLTPLFVGEANLTSASVEFVKEYKFDLYDGLYYELSDIPPDIDPIRSSNWRPHINTEKDSYRWPQRLEEGHIYSLVYTIRTNNGYEGSSKPYPFSAVVTTFGNIPVVLDVDSTSDYCRENGCINLYLTSQDKKTGLSGCYVLSRASEATNFEVFEDIKYLIYSGDVLEHECIYQDFTIESGVRYKYCIQSQNKAGVRSSAVYPQGNYPQVVNFEYSFIMRDGVQLKLQFNNKMSSFKHTVLRSKQDTLGGKYPVILQNGNAYYAEFPVTGMISFHMDEDETFFKALAENAQKGIKPGYYYRDELVISADKFDRSYDYRTAPSDENNWRIDTNLTENNIFVERIFREKVEEFLNKEDNCKLFRSATEGNKTIALLNVTLTPEEKLGRMIYSFSATAYEILGHSLEDLDSAGIINIGEFMSLSELHETHTSYGQVGPIYFGWWTDEGGARQYLDHSSDIKEAIRKQIEISLGESTRGELEDITAIRLEYYPSIDLTPELTKLQAQINSGDTEAIAKKREMQQLQAALKGPKNTTIKLSINGKTIMVKPGKIYELDENIESLDLLPSDTNYYTQKPEDEVTYPSGPYDTFPILIYYECVASETEDEQQGWTESVKITKSWGQLTGIFTEDKKIQKRYDYNYSLANSQTFTLTDPDGRDTNYHVYSTKNIYDVILEDARTQIEKKYYNGRKFVQNDKGEWVNSSNVYYEFDMLTALEIEADEGTVIHVGRSAEDYSVVRIGPTCRWRLDPAFLEEAAPDEICYVALPQHQFCIVNYKCQTVRITKGGSVA